MENLICEKLIKYSSGTIKPDENVCSDEYDLIFWSYFVPNGFNKKVINIIGEAGFDYEYEKNNFSFDYYPEEDLVIYKNEYYRNAIITDESFNRYKDNVIYRGETDVTASSIKEKEKDKDNICILPWIRYPRTKDGILIPLLIEKIFNRIPSKIVFIKKNW
jgi:hypothetical protein